ncbi:MAG: general stress protein [Acidimicrobiales bacterium]
MATNAREPVERTVVASYGDYREAQRAVDFLSDERFPVEHVAIVGSGLKLVETVTGRLSWGRAALSGAMSGLWIGLLVGWFVAVFSDGSSWWVILLSGALWGLAAGVAFGVAMYAATRGRRDFISHQQLRADAYEVTVDSSHADTARTVLGRLG